MLAPGNLWRIRQRKRHGKYHFGIGVTAYPFFVFFAIEKFTNNSHIWNECGTAEELYGNRRYV